MYSPHGKASLWSQDESIQKYVDKFWDAHLKATVFETIEFAEQKQQFCVGLPEDLKAYVNAQNPRTILTFIHHTLVASKIFPNALNATKNVNRTLQGDRSQQGNKQISYQKPQGDKKKDKGLYKGSNRLTPEEMESYRKENKCFKCGEKGHSYRACPKNTAKKDNPPSFNGSHRTYDQSRCVTPMLCMEKGTRPRYPHLV